MGILLPLIALLLILAALAIFIGMYLNNDHKDKNNNTADNKTEQTENKDKDKDKATNEKDQSNETAATKEDKSSESDNSTKKDSDESNEVATTENSTSNDNNDKNSTENATSENLSLIHISEPTRLHKVSRMPSSA